MKKRLNIWKKEELEKIKALKDEHTNKQRESHTLEETKIFKEESRTEFIITKEVEEFKEKIRNKKKIAVEILLDENHHTPQRSSQEEN